MIKYDKLWETMKINGISQYRLITEFNISKGLIYRLKRNESVTTHTLDMLCNILNCDICDIIEHIPDESYEIYHEEDHVAENPEDSYDCSPDESEFTTYNDI